MMTPAEREQWYRIGVREMAATAIGLIHQFSLTRTEQGKVIHILSEACADLCSDSRDAEKGKYGP